jgi:hypothetical protein
MRGAALCAGRARRNPEAIGLPHKQDRLNRTSLFRGVDQPISITWTDLFDALATLLSFGSARNFCKRWRTLALVITSPGGHPP